MRTTRVIAVSGVSGNIAQGIVKGLRVRRDSFRIVGLDCSPENVWFYMVEHPVPTLPLGELHYVDRLIEILCECSVELYPMGIDAEIPVVSAVRERIEEETRCQVVVSDDPFVRRATDKLA